MFLAVSTCILLVVAIFLFPVFSYSVLTPPHPDGISCLELSYHIIVPVTCVFPGSDARFTLSPIQILLTSETVLLLAYTRGADGFGEFLIKRVSELYVMQPVLSFLILQPSLAL